MDEIFNFCIGKVFGVCVVILIVGYFMFDKLKKKFAEEVALMIPSVYLDEKSFLEFYCLYSRRGFLYATEKE